MDGVDSRGIPMTQPSINSIKEAQRAFFLLHFAQ